MRVKKQKRHRKIVRFYSACFGFREPFKVLCDGTFVHHLLVNDLTPADHALANVLSAKALLFTTTCALAELKRLGKSFADSLNAANELAVARCDHEKIVSAAACIESVVSGGNSEHFFVATQDGDLRKKFHEVPGVPVIYGLKNALFIEQPSKENRQFVKSTEEKRLHISEPELQKLHKIVEPTDDRDEPENESESSHSYKNKGTRRALGVTTDKSKFKRKKAKGRNPLSCKKKKPKEDSAGAQNDVKEGGASGDGKKKRTRKRKKPKNDTMPVS